jgi:hypothetical protein
MSAGSAFRFPFGGAAGAALTTGVARAAPLFSSLLLAPGIGRAASTAVTAGRACLATVLAFLFHGAGFVILALVSFTAGTAIAAVSPRRTAGGFVLIVLEGLIGWI